MDRNQLGLHPLEKVNSIVDLGVRFDNNLTFREHMSEKINKAYSVLGIIKRNFIYMFKTMGHCNHCLHHLLPPVKKVCYNLRTPSYELIVHKLKQTRCSYLIRNDGV